MLTLKSICYPSILAAALVVVPTIGEATPITTATFQLTSDHCTGTGACLQDQTSGGIITVTQTATDTLSFDIALLNGNEFVNTGFDADIGFNLAGISTITYVSLTSGYVIPGGISPAQNTGSYHLDGTGFFNFGIQCGTGTPATDFLCGQNGGGGNAFAGPVDFTITASGLTIENLVRNANGQFFGVDIISGTTGNTGGIDASTGRTGGGDVIPEPASLALLAIGLLSLYGVGRRRRS